ncbi:hypothetical protein JCM33374_g1968 [Metschnikowia sp. JCM 33374]|nr:hypothetical protein JCM33374_g1968 [Metschnikowia sp. JCM 33374]
MDPAIPKQSLWSKVTMERSVEVLKGHGVNLDPLIETIFEFFFFGDDQYMISDTVIYSITVLSNRSSPRETFLHLYLVVLLLIFPVIVASDQEVTMSAKQQLRVSVKNCVTRLEDEVSILSYIDKPSLTIFIQVLRKMLHLSEMTSSRPKLSHSEGVFKEMAQDIKSLTITASECGEVSPFEELFIKGTINAFNAYSYELMANSATASQMVNITNIHNIGKAFQEVVLNAAHSLLDIPSGIQDGDDHKDVSYQKVSFAEFARRDPDLSKDTFKFWWVFSSMFQEYICVMSEVAALSQALA